MFAVQIRQLWTENEPGRTKLVRVLPPAIHSELYRGSRQVQFSLAYSPCRGYRPGEIDLVENLDKVHF